MAALASIRSPSTALPLFLVPAFAQPLRSQYAISTRRALSSSSLRSSIVSSVSAAAQNLIPQRYQRRATAREEQPTQAQVEKPKKRITASMRARMRTKRRNIAMRAVGRDQNKQRGLSAIHFSGTRKPLSIAQYSLPVPVLNPAKRAEPQTSENHGLWGFFNEEKTPMIAPENEAAFGRAWTYQELSIKSFEDLHRLYWACILEVNRTETRKAEMRRLRAGYGDTDAQARINACWGTNHAIKKVLADRHMNWTEANKMLTKTYLQDLLVEEGRDEQAAPVFEEPESFMKEQHGSAASATR